MPPAPLRTIFVGDQSSAVPFSACPCCHPKHGHYKGINQPWPSAPGANPTTPRDTTCFSLCLLHNGGEEEEHLWLGIPVQRAREAWPSAGIQLQCSSWGSAQDGGQDTHTEHHGSSTASAAGTHHGISRIPSFPESWKQTQAWGKCPFLHPTLATPSLGTPGTTHTTSLAPWAFHSTGGRSHISTNQLVSDEQQPPTGPTTPL